MNTPEGENQRGIPVLCANSCGFYGSALTRNLCSKCYRDFLLMEAKKTRIQGFGETKCLPESSSTAEPSSSAVVTGVVLNNGGSSNSYEGESAGGVSESTSTTRMPSILADFLSKANIPLPPNLSQAVQTATENSGCSSSGSTRVVVLPPALMRTANSSSSSESGETSSNESVDQDEVFGGRNSSTTVLATQQVISSSDIPESSGISTPAATVLSETTVANSNSISSTVSPPAIPPQTTAAAAGAEARNSGRCSKCNKRVGLLGFQCRCQEYFCGAHRHADCHECSFDFKSLGRQQLSEANQRVVADKLNNRI